LDDAPACVNLRKFNVFVPTTSDPELLLHIHPVSAFVLPSCTNVNTDATDDPTLKSLARLGAPDGLISYIPFSIADA